MKLTPSPGSLLVVLRLCEKTFRIGGIRAEHHQSPIDRVIPMPDKSTERIPYGFVLYAKVTSQYDSDVHGNLKAGNIF